MNESGAIDFRVMRQYFDCQLRQVGITVLVDRHPAVVGEGQLWSNWLQHARLYIFNRPSQIKQRQMFNPKEALERIRRTKNQKQEVKSITEGVQPLFTAAEPIERNLTNSIEDRVGKLELMVLRLTEQLTNSNESVEKLKRENSSLETQILKLEYENSQLKSKEAYSSIRRNGSNKRIVQPINEQPERHQNNRENEKLRKVDSHLVEKEVYLVQVENCIEEIKNEPIENVLKRRENQFRARKPDPKQSQAGNKYLKELAAIEKEYSKTMKKPVLVIKLDDIDFQ